MQTMLVQEYADKTNHTLKKSELIPEHFLVQAGHVQIQQLNTGIPRYKIDRTTRGVIDKEVYKSVTRNRLKELFLSPSSTSKRR